MNSQHLVYVLDILNSEFTAWFVDDNVKLWVAMVSLLPSSENYLNAESLHPLLEYAQSIPAIKAEIGGSLTFDQLSCEVKVFNKYLVI